MKKFNINNILKSLDKEGIAIVENILSKNESNYFKKKVIKILNDRKKNNLYVGNNLYQVIENYFVFDNSINLALTKILISSIITTFLFYN